MSIELNKSCVRRFYEEVWNNGHLEVVEEVAAPECIRHDPSGPMRSGPAGFQQTATMLRTAFPDLQLSIDLMVAEADMVVARWTIRGTQQGPLGPIPPTGKRVAFAGVNIFRLASGKIIEIWNHRDDLRLYQQLGDCDDLWLHQQLGARPSPSDSHSGG
jgi:steroid delta-isomerase-like uncharacterized protein